VEAIPFHPLVYVARTPIARVDHHAGCLLVQPPEMAHGRDALDGCGKLDEHSSHDDYECLVDARSRRSFKVK
jgi:hypothetical protein